jgi:hypothetical protein
MESIGLLFNLIFSLLKLAILASIHATTSLIFFKIIGRSFPDSWFAKITENKTKYWFKSGLVISLLIFFFSFTYWGDNGVFNTARIPLGYGQALEETDTGLHGCPAFLGDFAIKDRFVCGHRSTVEGGPLQDDNIEYIVWDLETNETKVIKSKYMYANYAKKYHLPTEDQFQDFQSNYWNHWFSLNFFFII